MRLVAHWSVAIALTLTTAMAHAQPATGDDYRICVGQNYEARIQACTRMLGDPATQPESRISAYLRRGEAYGQLGTLEPALVDITEVLKLRPKSFMALNSRGMIHGRMRNYDLAREDFEAAALLEPNNSSIHNNLGANALRRKDFEAALLAFTRSVQVDPQNLLAMKNKAEALGELNRQGEARALLQEVVTAPDRPGNTDDLRAKASAQEMLDRLITNNPVKPNLGKRIALVIGNSSYSHAGKLENPSNDAQAVAKSLRELGFVEVIESLDLSRQQLTDALLKFGDLAEDSDWAMIYYAGHGIEVNGINYIVPVDAKLQKSTHVEDEAISLDRLIGKVEPAKQLRLVVLDACRNNPFLSRMVRDNRTRSVGVGLARIEPKGGTMIAYAARDGTVAQDGAGANSPYAIALLRHLAEPDLDIRFLFDKVRDTVLSPTNGEQMPFTYGSLPAERFVFRPR